MGRGPLARHSNLVRRAFLAFLLIALSSGIGVRDADLSVLAAGGGQGAGPGYAPDEILVKFHRNVKAADRDHVRNQVGGVTRGRFRSGAEHWKLGKGLTTDQALARLRSHPFVEYAEPNYVLSISTAPNDPLYPQMYGLHNTGQTGGTPGADIRAEQAWDVSTGSRSVRVAVIDTGIDFNHPDLAANIWTNPGEIPGNGIDDDHNGFVDDVHGWDFVNGDANPMDDNGHGTHVSGTIGALGNNGVGVVGVNWRVSLVPLKFLDGSGSGTTAGAIAAIDYGVALGVDVMSNSWGGGGFSQALLDAIRGAAAAEVVFVAAAGNDGTNNDLIPHYPSSYDSPNIIAVAATDASDRLASFSNYGVTSVDIGAPGVNILSTFPGNSYGQLSGTSMATPHVSGAAALIRALSPAIGAVEVKRLLMDSADRISALAGRTVSGGRLNAFMAIATPDSVPPAAIADVATATVTNHSVELRWTATGDDGLVGTASRYDVRYSTSPIDSSSFDVARQATPAPVPAPAGSPQAMTVDGLDFDTTYYFAVKALDEWGNASPISNVASARTFGPPDVAVAPGSLTESLFTGGTVTGTITISNSGAGELLFDTSARAPSNPPAPGGGGSPTASASAASTVPWDTSSPPASGTGAAAQGGIGAAATGRLKILLLQSGADVTEIRPLLASFADVAAVDVFDGRNATPTLASLSNYHSVIVVANSAFGDPVGTGNVLADYADAGGGVVLTLASFIPGWQLGGRFSSGGYNPLIGLGGPIGSSPLGAFDAAHPIMAGVTQATGDLLGSANVAPGASLVASWSIGQPFVATKGKNLVAVNIFVGSPGRWSGDIPLILHNAAIWSSDFTTWLSASPKTGVVPAGGSVDVTVAFDAAGLNGGDYDAEVVVESNDPDEPEVVVPAHLHVTGAPDIAVSGRLDFGALFVGASRKLNLTVSNEGTDVLTVSRVAAGDAAYTADATSFVLAPGAKRVVGVTFQPDRPEEIDTELVLESNDPDEPVLSVHMTGEGLVPPDVSVTPASLSESLFTGQTSTHVVTIRNSGGSDLTFEMAFRGVAGVAPAYVAPPPLAAGAGALRSDTAPQGYQAQASSMASVAGATVLIVQDVLPWGSHANETILAANGIVFDVIPSASLGSTDLSRYRIVLVPSDQPTSYYTRIASASNQIDAFVRGGGVLEFHAAGWGWSDGDASLVTLPGGMRIRQALFGTNQVLDPTHPLMAGVPNPFTGDYASHASFTSIPAAATRIAATSTGDVNLVVYRLGLGTVVTGGQTFEIGFDLGWAGGKILTNMIPFSHSLAMAWLSAAPRTGVVPVGGSADVVVTFDAARLYGGDYDAEVVVASNDPDEPEVAVPAHLHVTGAPDIAVSGQEVSVESVRTYSGSGALTQHALVVTAPPAGGGTLELVAEGDYGDASESATATAEGLTLGTVGAVGSDCVPARGTFPIGAASLATLISDGVVHVAVQNSPNVDDFCSPNQHTVRLKYATPADRLEFGAMFVGLSRRLAITVSNTGTDVLSVGGITSSDAAFVPDAGSLTLAPGERAEVGVTFTPGIAEPIEGSLTIESNDPDEPVLSVHMTGEGLVPPDVAVMPASLSESLFTGQSSTRTVTIENSGGSDLTFEIETRFVAVPGAGRGFAPPPILESSTTLPGIPGGGGNASSGPMAPSPSSSAVFSGLPTKILVYSDD
ncbi:MAG: S8 family serine peptidase, partial [Acidobacteria bacterium]|nr:S8 family serine peptidase [Acidobacteriota bacterium]